MIEAQGLMKQYGTTLAVNDLTFTVQPGRVTGFLGPNGAGKSTTMRMLLGLDRPTGGTILIKGQRYQDLKYPLHTVGALLDAKWVHPNRSAHSHLRWIARSNKISAARVNEVLDLVGLSEVGHRRAGGFSLGMSQRLGIAAALLGDPEILLFDEPVNGLDPEGILWIRRFMQGLAAEGRSVFVSSHLMSEMALTATDLVVIGRGHLIAQSSTADFVSGASEATVRLRSPQAIDFGRRLAELGLQTELTEPHTLVVTGVTTDRVGRLAAEHNITLLELASHTASLEEAFIEMTGRDVQYAGTAGATTIHSLVSASEER